MNLWERLLSVLSAVLKTRLRTGEPVKVTLFKTTLRTGYVQPKVADFLAKIRPYALDIEAETGIPWMFAAVQSGHESRWGESRLTTVDNNLFGYTANADWLKENKPVARYLTRESSDKPPDQIKYWTTPGDIFEKKQRPDGGTDLQVWRPFRKYSSWGASLRDWANLLQRRYPKSFEAAKAGNFEAFAKGLQEGGYATDRDPKTGELVYARKLIKIHKDIEGIA
jgi:flagellar protein FlgJ